MAYHYSDCRPWLWTVPEPCILRTWHIQRGVYGPVFFCASHREYIAARRHARRHGYVTQTRQVGLPLV